jgi:hypothetical protein
MALALILFSFKKGHRILMRRHREGLKLSYNDATMTQEGLSNHFQGRGLSSQNTVHKSCQDTIEGFRPESRAGTWDAGNFLIMPPAKMCENLPSDRWRQGGGTPHSSKISILLGY